MFQNRFVQYDFYNTYIFQRHEYNIILKGFEGIDRLNKSGAQEYKKKTIRLALLVLFGDFIEISC